MVRASDRNDGGQGLIPGRSRLVTYRTKTSGRRLTSLNCAAGCVVVCVTHIDMPHT